MKLKIIILSLCLLFVAGVVHAQTQTGYRVPAGYDCGNGARVTSRMNFQVGTGSTFVMRYGTTTVTGSGSTGYMSGTDSAYPRWVWTPSTGRMNFLDITLQQNGVDIAAYNNSAALAAAISDETGTNTVVYSSSPVINNATLSGSSIFPSGVWNSGGKVGIGTSTASGANLSINTTGNYYIGVGTDRGQAGQGTGAYSGNFFWENGAFQMQADQLGVGIPSIALQTYGGNVGIGTTTPSNILTLPVSSGTDPIADAWTLHCLADYKEMGTETVEMIQSAAKDKIKNTPVSLFTKKAIISDEEAEREPKQKYQDKIKESSKADLELYTTETGVAVNDNSYVDELLDSMWETKDDRLAIVEANKQKLTAAKKALPKFQRKNYGIVAEDAPPEAQVLREDGSLQGVDTSVLVGILWANAQKQEERISALESEITNLKQKLP